MRAYPIRFGAAAAAQFRALSVQQRVRVEARLRLLAKRAALASVREYPGSTRARLIRDQEGGFFLTTVGHHWLMLDVIETRRRLLVLGIVRRRDIRREHLRAR